TSEFGFVEQPDDYLLFFGRIHPEKGAREAIAAAKHCQKKLIIAGLIQDTDYFNTHILPAIDNKNVVYVGNCGPAQRNKLLGSALALLHLISFEEPFGLSVVEAMCCGTPVVAFNRGSMPELIRHGRTGYLVTTIEEAVAAVYELSKLNRNECRQWALAMFSKERMTDEYLRLYEQILNA
ncbi:MAG TPA: glycosyltransferase, partial [Flavisolibacter sp.]|nr:glycosyltransferase [Flavisolibacter sp.]